MGIGAGCIEGMGAGAVCKKPVEALRADSSVAVADSSLVSRIRGRLSNWRCRMGAVPYEPDGLRAVRRGARTGILRSWCEVWIELIFNWCTVEGVCQCQEFAALFPFSISPEISVGRMELS